ncbi:MAG: hypothetical protein ACXW22_10150, partial [Allosphingosinicella sp.]
VTSSGKVLDMSDELITGIFIALSVIVALVVGRSRDRRTQMWIFLGYVAVAIVYAAYSGGLLN